MNKENNITDNNLRKILADSKMKAGGNLKYRVMQQVRTEASLLQKDERKKTYFHIKSSLVILGLMYIILFALVLTFYLYDGIKALETNSFLLLVSITSVACGLFFSISILDDKLRSRIRKGVRKK